MNRRFGLLGAVLAATLLLTARSATAKEVTVPVDISFGPAAYFFTGALFADQPVYSGIAFDAYAVIDKKTIEENKGRVPKRYRRAVKQFGEIRYSPYIFIPDAFFISPPINDTQMYGVNWRPWSVSLTCLPSPTRVNVGTGVLFTLIYIDSRTLPSPTFFVRPGLDLKLDFELQLSRSFLLSAGWASQLYVPQRLGEFGIFPLDENTIWHVGMAYAKIHIRFPYTAKL